MGHLAAVRRLIARDLRRRPAQALLLVLAIAATITTLTLGFALHGVTNKPWQQTRTGTKGPDVVAQTVGSTPRPTDLIALSRLPGVSAAAGPYPVAFPSLDYHGESIQVSAEGRDRVAVVDQPLVTSGTWTRTGGVVIEQGLAEALGARVGDTISLSGRVFDVVGIAVTSARSPYPLTTPGLVWLTASDAKSLATSARPLSFILELKLVDPAAADAFANAHSSPSVTLESWQTIRDHDARRVTVEQPALFVGAWLMAALAIASIAVLVGGRITEQMRRVGLLKAVGATPWFVAFVLLAENVVLSLLAVPLGLAAGLLVAPLLTSPGSGLLGSAGAPSLTGWSIGAAVLAAVAIAGLATVLPAIKGARTSTINALSAATRAPGRHAGVNAVSRHLPVALLLGLRLLARRPWRALLAVLSLAIPVTLIVAVLALRHHVDASSPLLGPSSGLLPGFQHPMQERIGQVIGVMSVALVVLSAVNVTFITWTTVIDNRRPCAMARAMGATPRQVSAGLTVAQLVPALLGALIGIPAGFALYVGAGGRQLSIPPARSLLILIASALMAVAVLAGVPSLLGTRKPVAEVLRAE
jgi:putative ABC transport system permease protein